jgi:PTS system nitrogen regulatory IIA component
MFTQVSRTISSMTLDSIIDKQSVLASLKAQNKKQLLQELSQVLANRVAIDHRLIFETLFQREKLGSTGIGQGIAIPHGKLPSISRVYGLFARLAVPVEFDSVDGQPVDLVFVLLAPEHAGADHLKALARISPSCGARMTQRVCMPSLRNLRPIRRQTPLPPDLSRGPTCPWLGR